MIAQVKAMTPRLYPSNSHGGLGWAIFVISLIVLGGDIYRLLRQVLDTFIGLRGASRWAALSSVWNTLKGHKAKIALYDAQEEERMLAEAEAGDEADEVYHVERRETPSRTNSNSSDTFDCSRVANYEKNILKVLRGYCWKVRSIVCCFIYHYIA